MTNYVLFTTLVLLSCKPFAQLHSISLVPLKTISFLQTSSLNSSLNCPSCDNWFGICCCTSQGLESRHLFAHHNNDFSSNLISWYDEQFNKRQRQGRDVLPDQRYWDSNKLAWEPEKSDHPIRGRYQFIYMDWRRGIP